jgi:rhomboid protease GluP
MAQSYIPCPRCGRMTDGSTSCTSCGAPRPGLLARLTDWTRVDPNGERIVAAVVTVNVIFYLLSLVISGHSGGMGMNPLTFLSPDQKSLWLLGATGTVPVLNDGRTWTLVSANYLHGGLLHILFNMMALRQVGTWVSAEFGPSRMFTIYTLSGVLGYVVSCIAGVPFTIGASAAVCGLIGALFYYGKSRGGNYGAAVSREVSGWLISLFIFGFVVPGINNWGHGGGVVGGIIFGKLLGYREIRPEGTLHRLLALLCLVGTIAILIMAAVSAFLLRDTETMMMPFHHFH